MNQRETKLLILLFLLPLYAFYAAITLLIRIIYYFSRILGLTIDNQSENILKAAELVKNFRVLFFISAIAIIAAGVMSKYRILNFENALIAILTSLLVSFLFYQAYVYFYFKSKKFQLIKESISNHTRNCNELNIHIEELKSTSLSFESHDYGEGILSDSSNFNFTRSEWSKINKNRKIYDCSSAVLKNASNQPFKYLCKYFNIGTSEETLSTVEIALNNFLAATQGRTLLEAEREKILAEIEEPAPFLIIYFNKKTLMEKLGFNTIDLSEINYPSYTFRYISPGGNSSYDFSIKLDMDNLEKFIFYLGGLIKFKKSIEGQRALMTKTLREKIKTRDNHTCKLCGLSTMKEENLLLEIDHIIPLSKGGITSEQNLQTLCWKCNRSKGTKIL